MEVHLVDLAFEVINPIKFGEIVQIQILMLTFYTKDHV